jgi:hypothetical protein
VISKEQGEKFGIQEKIINDNEKKQWQRVLGGEKKVEFNIPPLPSAATPEVQKNLEEIGLKSLSIPRLELYGLKKLQELGVEEYLKILHCCYPQWNPFEELDDTQKKDHSIMRNLEKRFWWSVKDERVDFPSLPGKWIAVETLVKPKNNEKYQPSKITDMLGFKDRFNKSWDDIKKAIKKNEKKVLNKIGLNEGKLRLLEPLEYNLLANREGWGATDIYEWTNTKFRELFTLSSYVIVGHYVNGGATNVSCFCPEGFNSKLGVRFAIEFDPKSQLLQ